MAPVEEPEEKGSDDEGQQEDQEEKKEVGKRPHGAYHSVPFDLFKSCK